MSEADRRKENNAEYVSFHVAGQLLGVPVGHVQEILPYQRIARVPLAPGAVAGLLNLRGEIVTTVDVRRSLDLARCEDHNACMNIVVADQGELFSLLVDSVGDVVAVRRSDMVEPPPTLDARWRECCEGVYRLERGLLIVAVVRALLDVEGDVRQP